jgi:hypothetical protein
LLRLTLSMDGVKPIILMGKLKQPLPNRVSPNNKLFLSMFKIRMPPTVKEAVGDGDHRTATMMVRATDAL